MCQEKTAVRGGKRVDVDLRRAIGQIRVEGRNDPCFTLFARRIMKNSVFSLLLCVILISLGCSRKPADQGKPISQTHRVYIVHRHHATAVSGADFANQMQGDAIAQAEYDAAVKSGQYDEVRFEDN